MYLPAPHSVVQPALGVCEAMRTAEYHCTGCRRTWSSSLKRTRLLHIQTRCSLSSACVRQCARRQTHHCIGRRRKWCSSRTSTAPHRKSCTLRSACVSHCARLQTTALKIGVRGAVLGNVLGGSALSLAVCIQRERDSMQTATHPCKRC